MVFDDSTTGGTCALDPMIQTQFNNTTMFRKQQNASLATGKDQIILQNKKTFLLWSLSKIRKTHGISASDPSNPKTGPNNLPH